jgi:general secretion pathway protein G
MKRRCRIALWILGTTLVVGAASLVAVALTVPRITCRLHDARQTKAKADIKAIVDALETFRIEHGAIPTTAEGLEPLVNAGSETYLSKVPIDPWGNSYQYASDGHRYSVASFGADGKQGGDGNDSDIDDSSAFR